MITKFYLFEKLNLDDVQIEVEQSDQKLLDNLIDKLSLVIQKRIKRNLRIVKISGKMNQKKLQGMEKTLNTELNIKMSNKDELKINYIYNDSVNRQPFGEITLKINDKTVYDIRKNSFTPSNWIEKVVDEYKKYLKNERWKINN